MVINVKILGLFKTFHSKTIKYAYILITTTLVKYYICAFKFLHL